MAILWWINTGIYLKMRSDVDFVEGGSSAETSFWKPEYISKNIPLTITHLLLSIIILGVGLLLSIITFCLEILNFVYKKKVAGMEFDPNQGIAPKVSNGSKLRSTKVQEKKDVQVIFQILNKKNHNWVNEVYQIPQLLLEFWKDQFIRIRKISWQDARKKIWSTGQV